MKDNKEQDDFSGIGRLFHICDPETENDLEPSDVIVITIAIPAFSSVRHENREMPATAESMGSDALCLPGTSRR